MPPKPHLSVSQIGMLERCGMQWYYRYKENLRIAPGVALIRGKATHRSIEHNLKHVMAANKPIDRAAALDIAAEAVDKDWSDELLLSSDEKALGNKLKGQTIDQAVALSALHYDEVAPRIEPVHVERTWELDLEGFPFSIQGVIDVQEPSSIRDTKTKGKSPTAKEADQSIQLTAYAMAMRTLDGVMPDNVQIDALVLTKEPKYVAVRSTRTQQDFQRFLHRVERVAEAIEKEVFMPASEDSWVCSETFCGYYKDICPFGAKGRRRLAS